MKIKFLLLTGATLAAFAVSAENSNNPGVDINSTSVGTRMRNAWEPTPYTWSTAGEPNSSVGARMHNASPEDRYSTADVDSDRSYSPDYEGDLSRTATIDESQTPDSTAGVSTGSAYNTNLTAQDQSNKPADLELTRKIRADLMSRDLSMQAKNVKIITVDGIVTLKGEVPSRQEKQIIQGVASGKAGKMNVRDELVVKK